MKFPQRIRLFIVPCVNDAKYKGVAQPGGGTVHLGPATDYDMVRLLLHEVLRVQHPQWSPAQVSETAEARYAGMGWRAKANYLRGALAKMEIGWPPGIE